mmetsp:Transcript_13453/g.26410  ORF Transcript_13453/g.26410 Transcript_13453/m.26410 type:complete len:109 (-) Transcript_13453:1221-1547(-)
MGIELPHELHAVGREHGWKGKGAHDIIQAVLPVLSSASIPTAAVLLSSTCHNSIVVDCHLAMATPGWYAVALASSFFQRWFQKQMFEYHFQMHRCAVSHKRQQAALAL